ncbi:MAG: hypothetical protein V4635_13440 [Bacteroidota bacterium]
MNNLLHITASVAFAIALISCAPEASMEKVDLDNSSLAPVIDHSEETVTLGEFVAWCANRKNRLAKEKTISDIRYNLTYLPTETMAFIELRNEKYDFEKFRKVCEGYTEMVYFKFRIEALEGSGELLKYDLRSSSEYESRVRYLSFDMQMDLFLVQGSDTISPGLYHFERAYGVAPYATVMLGFSRNQLNSRKEFTVVFNDRLFDKGFIKFNYADGQIINLPNISGL